MIDVKIMVNLIIILIKTFQP